ncbi:SIP domain-containing protein [Chitinophaga sp. Hz27]|uniref:SIP domain-containing protein n=1 Tax=Chitinophaga sp. Hz27 TaxID=3347169 RepID=UPI0035E2CEDE
MITSIEKREVSLLENIFIKTGKVLAVRTWDTGDFYEVDLHLPKAKPAHWNTVQRIICRTASFHYCDYTPAQWDCSTKTCTLFIDGGHNGRGCRWVRSLQPDDALHYASIDAVKQAPAQDTYPIFLGDQSAIGHFSALQQLSPNGNAATGIMVVNKPEHKEEFVDKCRWLQLTPVSRDENYFDYLSAMLQQLPPKNYTFFLAGNSYLVANTRKFLREKGFQNGQIKAQGFWH